MRAGNLYHRIAFYPKATTRDSFSGSVDTWATPTINTRGEIREVGGSKDLSNEEKFFSKSKELTIRYRAAVTENMKLTIDGATDFYIITYIEIIGRNEGMRLSIEKENS